MKNLLFARTVGTLFWYMRRTKSLGWALLDCQGGWHEWVVEHNWTPTVPADLPHLFSAFGCRAITSSRACAAIAAARRALRIAAPTRYPSRNGPRWNGPFGREAVLQFVPPSAPLNVILSTKQLCGIERQ